MPGLPSFPQSDDPNTELHEAIGARALGARLEGKRPIHRCRAA
jgi:hypothetical protein